MVQTKAISRGNWIASLPLVVSVCLSEPASAQTYFPPVDAPDDWRTLLAHPGPNQDDATKQLIKDTLGLDWDALLDAYTYSYQVDSGSELLVIRNGWVAFDAGPTRRVTPSASVSKSLAGLGFAKLWDLSSRGGSATRIGPQDLADDYLPSSWSGSGQGIRLRHLLSMSSGIQPHDSPRGPGYTEAFILGQPSQVAPGTRWAYSSLSVDLSSIVFQTVAGRPLADFLNQEIFQTIGANVTWESLENSTITKASSSARMSSFDLARIAYLLLNKGNWSGQQIIGEQYVEMVTKWASDLAGAQFEPTPDSAFVVPRDAPQHYGHLFWTNRQHLGLGAAVPRDAYFAHGLGEDLMIVVPSLDLVVVRMGTQPQGQSEASFRSELMGRIMAGVATQSVVAAVLPASRSVQVGNTATAFATIVNSGTADAAGCGITPVTAVPADFLYQTTDPASNALTGTPNTPVAIAAGASQSYVFAFTPTADLPSTEVELAFDCTNTDKAPVTVGLNTLLLSAATDPVADIAALATTPSGDGVVGLPGGTGTGAFAVATANVGNSSTITASPDTGVTALPLTLSICTSDPLTGVCQASPAPSVTTRIDAGATPTFSVFAKGNGTVPFDPATNRIFVRFKDAGGVTRGSTSVAVQTVTP